VREERERARERERVPKYIVVRKAACVGRGRADGERAPPQPNARARPTEFGTHTLSAFLGLTSPPATLTFSALATAGASAPPRPLRRPVGAGGEAAGAAAGAAAAAAVAAGPGPADAAERRRSTTAQPSAQAQAATAATPRGGKSP